MGKWGSFGDQWRQKAGYYLDPLTVIHQADPAHAANWGDPNPVWEAPPEIADENTPAYLYDQDMLSGDWVQDGGDGLVLDTTPVDHTEGAEFDVTPFGPETTAENAATAGKSFGADRNDSFYPNPVMDYTTVQTIPRFQGLDSPAPHINPVVLVRGLNSYGDNNPEGFRRGWVEQTFTDRKLQVPAWNARDHDRRLLTANTAYANNQLQPPVEGTSGVPFSSLAKSLKDISQKPMMRRLPESISESVITDGAEQGYDDIPEDWVV